MYNKELWTSFDAIYCLTLEGDIERQRHASTELCDIGLNGFQFVEGVQAQSEAVRDAYRAGRVQSFPPCFRCGKSACGREDCNNVLIEPQVGCFLSFMKIFKLALASRLKTFLLVEDDVKFHDYAPELARAALARPVLESLGFFDEEPCLIGLGRGMAPTEDLTFDGDFAFLERRKQPQNPCFAFNRGFAALALARFRRISHTCDVFIHFELSDEARHYSLEPPLSYELSTSTGQFPSRIHPKQIALDRADSGHARATANAALKNHFKHVKYIPLAVIGNPRGGTGFMARALRGFGFDVGHESMGVDGISSWMFAVGDVDLPFGVSGYARNSRFVHAEKTIAVVRTSPQSVFALQIENAKNIQSYAFRRRWIKSAFDVDVDAFSPGFDRALATYVFWYKIVALRHPLAWISLERAAKDIGLLFESGLVTKRKDPDPAILNQIVNDAKPYFGHVYKYTGDFDYCFKAADPFLQMQYRELRGELFSVFNQHI